MIRALNYPRLLSEPIVLDLVTNYTGEPGNALVRFNPVIAREFTTDEITSLMSWYADGDESEEDYVTSQLLPRLLGVIAPTWFGERALRNNRDECRDNLRETIRELAGSIGGQSDRFYSKFCASGRHEAWRQGRLYATILEIDSDGDYRTGDLYIPFWMTDQLLPINRIVPLREFEFIFREDDLRNDINLSLIDFLNREGLNVQS